MKNLRRLLLLVLVAIVYASCASTNYVKADVTHGTPMELDEFSLSGIITLSPIKIDLVRLIKSSSSMTTSTRINPGTGLPTSSSSTTYSTTTASYGLIGVYLGNGICIDSLGNLFIDPEYVFNVKGRETVEITDKTLSYIRSESSVIVKQAKTEKIKTQYAIDQGTVMLVEKEKRKMLIQSIDNKIINTLYLNFGISGGTHELSFPDSSTALIKRTLLGAINIKCSDSIVEINFREIIDSYSISLVKINENSIRIITSNFGIFDLIYSTNMITCLDEKGYGTIAYLSDGAIEVVSVYRDYWPFFVVRKTKQVYITLK